MPTIYELLLLGLSLDTFQIGLDLQIFSREVREAKRTRKGNGLFWFVCPLILAIKSDYFLSADSLIIFMMQSFEIQTISA